MTTRWQDCRIVLHGAATPVSVAGRAIARATLLRAWGEGDRSRVVRVVSPRGDELAPIQVDWSGIPDGPPQRRHGRPPTGRDAQLLVRCSADERAAWEAAAEAAEQSIGAWARDVLSDAARRAR